MGSGPFGGNSCSDPSDEKGVRMADRNRKSIGRVRLGNFGKAQKHLHHMLHLLFSRPAMPDYRLLDLKSGIFMNRKGGVYSGYDCRTPCLSELEGALYVVGKKDLFDSHFIRPVFVYDLAQPFIDPFQSARKIGAAVGEDGAVINMDQPVPLFPEQAVAGDA